MSEFWKPSEQGELHNRWGNGRSCMAYRGVWRPTPNIELYHHGVKGMKWGVRRQAKNYLVRTKRDLHMLNDREYNQKVRSLKDQRDLGSIDQKQYKSAKKDAKLKRKETTKSIKSMKVDKSLADTKKRFDETRKRAIKEIPHYRLKRGARTVSTLITAIAAGSIVGSAAAVGYGAALVGSAYGASMGAAYATGGALSIGATAGLRTIDHKIRKKINQAVT